MPDQFEQQPFQPEVTDDQIIGLARSLYGTGNITIEGGVLEHLDNGAVVAAEIFLSSDEISQLGAYVPHEEPTYEPGPALHSIITGARDSFVEDIRRGCNMAMLDNANYKEPLWERIARHSLILLVLAASFFYWGHHVGDLKGYKQGVNDMAQMEIEMLKQLREPEPEPKVQQ